MVLLAGLQLALGFLNVVLLAPTWMQLVHLLVADLLWIAFVMLGASLLAAPSEDGAYSAVSRTPVGPSLIASAGLDRSSSTRV